MSLPIISADQRLAERRGTKAAIFGQSGRGKTSLLWTLQASTTLFFDLEAGDLATAEEAARTRRANRQDLAADQIEVDRPDQRLGLLQTTLIVAGTLLAPAQRGIEDEGACCRLRCDDRFRRLPSPCRDRLRARTASAAPKA